MDIKYFSNSPHIKGNNSTKKIMINIAIALLPACIAGSVFFGLQALLVLALALISAVASELVYLLICKRPFKEIVAQFDFTSVVTGLLVGMVMSPSVPFYVPILASIFAIVVVKMLFGGTGKNIVNPAITGRIFAFLSFGIAMTSFPNPNFMPVDANIETGATALTELLNGNFTISNLNLLLGIGVAGCIGETCKLALIVGGIYLIIRDIIDFKWPIIYIGVTGLFTVALNNFQFSYFLPSILSGGLILGAIFMATDYTTTPNTQLGNIIYFVFLGLLTAGLRQATGIEVVSFAILLGNLIVPLIDKFITARPFGYVKQTKNKGTK